MRPKLAKGYQKRGIGSSDLCGAAVGVEVEEGSARTGTQNFETVKVDGSQR